MLQLRPTKPSGHFFLASIEIESTKLMTIVKTNINDVNLNFIFFFQNMLIEIFCFIYLYHIKKLQIILEIR
jgi:hypothetical protein